MTAFLERIAASPLPYDAARGADVLDTLSKSDAPELAGLIAGNPDIRELLLGTFSCSPYLSALSLRDPRSLADCLTLNPETHLKDARAALAASIDEAPSSKEVMAHLRQFKRRMALLVALADVGQVWTTGACLEAMSLTADATLKAATDFLFRKAREAGQVTAGDGMSEPRGYFIIAMGKLGAMELNYSSDIDFMVFYDAARARLASDVEPSTFFVKLTRELVRLLQEHTANGYVFRTDLRLRPDPGATQIALSTDAGLTYYESFGQNWERAALIKARIAAGDEPAGEEFLRQLAPFVWRKYLDYAAVADIHAMKRRVHAHKGHGAVAVEGHDIKLGRGGIRDIEFFAQTQQLIMGGRRPELRTRGTIETLGRLAEGGFITRADADVLTEAYYFLRRIENRLQMVGDQQTHILPADRAELDRIARFSGYEETDAFANALLATFKQVEAHYGALFEKLPEPPASLPNIVISAEADPAAIASSRAAWIPQSASSDDRDPRLAVGPLRRDAQRDVARAADRVPSLAARCLRPHRRAGPRARHLRQGDFRDAGGLAAFLPPCRQSEPAQAARRYHGHGAEARAHHRAAPASSRCGARSRFLRCRADP